jgi:hypothetical protein
MMSLSAGPSSLHATLHPITSGPTTEPTTGRVHRQGDPGLAWPGRRQDPLHRAGRSLGETLQREFKPQARRRAAQRRNLPHTQGGRGAHRAMAAALQHRQTPQLPGLQANSPQAILSDPAAPAYARLRSAQQGPNRRPNTLIGGGLPIAVVFIAATFVRWLNRVSTLIGRPWKRLDCRHQK